MNTKNRTILATTVLAGFLLAGLFLLEGCKKKEAPAPPPTEANKPAAVTKAKEATVAAIEQTTCPVLAAPIDKNVFTEYKGKKVYFCCADCKKAFELDPEKYVSKLPQFAK
jgi:membrane fusion protein, copper/silver efflux system